MFLNRFILVFWALLSCPITTFSGNSNAPCSADPLMRLGQCTELLLPVVSVEQNFLASCINLFDFEKGVALHASASIFFPIIPFIADLYFGGAALLITTFLLALVAQIPNIIYTVKHVSEAKDRIGIGFYIAFCIIAPIIPVVGFFSWIEDIFVLQLILNCAILARYIAGSDNMIDRDFPVYWINIGLILLFSSSSTWTFFAAYYFWIFHRYHKVWSKGLFPDANLTLYDPDFEQYNPTTANLNYASNDFPSDFDEGITMTPRPSDRAYESAQKLFGEYTSYIHPVLCLFLPIIFYEPTTTNLIVIAIVFNFILQLPSLIVKLIMPDKSKLTWKEIAKELFYHAVIPSLCMYFRGLAFVLIGLRTIFSVGMYFAKGESIRIFPTKIILTGLSLIDPRLFICCYLPFLLYRYLPHWTKEIFGNNFKVQTFDCIDPSEGYIFDTSSITIIQGAITPKPRVARGPNGTFRITRSYLRT